MAENNKYNVLNILATDLRLHHIFLHHTLVSIAIIKMPKWSMYRYQFALGTASAVYCMYCTLVLLS